MHKTRQNRLALLGVRHFWMKLNCVKLPRFVSHTSDGRRRIARDDFESWWEFGHFVAVTHPHIE